MGYQRRQHRILRTDYAAEKTFHDPDGLVEYICLPPNNMTSKLQPMDAGIIAWLKQKNNYRRCWHVCSTSLTTWRR